MARGYPDFLRLDSQADEPIAALAGTNFNSSQTFGPYECSRWKNVNIVFAGGTARTKLRVEWASNAAFTANYHFTDWCIGVDERIDWLIPNRGSFVRVTLTHNAANPQQAALTLTFTNRSGHPVNLANTGILLSTGTLNVAAGATVTTATDEAFAGRAIFDLVATPAAWFVAINTINELGAVTTLYQFTNAGGGRQRAELFLPTSELQVAFTNSDAAIRQFDARLVALVYGPGA